MNNTVPPSYSARIVGDLYTHLMAQESISAFRESDEIASDGFRDGEKYMIQKADERRSEALELMASAFGSFFDPDNKQLYIH